MVNLIVLHFEDQSDNIHNGPMFILFGIWV